MANIGSTATPGSGRGFALRDFMQHRVLPLLERWQMLRGGPAGRAASARRLIRAVSPEAADAIRIEATGDHLMLRGKVHSREIADAAVNAASRVKGVRQVHNFIQIEG